MPNLMLEDKHKLLFQAAFGEKSVSDKALSLWQANYQLEDLDWTTRSILPLFVQRFQNQSHDFQRFRQYYQQTWLANLVRLDQLKSLIRDLHEQDVPVCLLKGSAMLIHYYKNMGMRPGISDIDLLIPQEKLPDAMEVLKKNGMRASSTFRHAGPNYEGLIRHHDSHILRYHHAINFNSYDLDIDLHWRMSPYMKNTSFHDLKNTMQCTDLNQTPVFLLSKSHHFIHTCFHGTSQIADHRKMWWIIDLLYLLNHKKICFDWDEIFDISKKNQVELYVYQAMTIVEEINPSLVPKQLMNKYENTKKSRSQSLRFYLNNHQNKLIKQFSSYYFLYQSSQDNKIKKMNLLMFIHFLKVYFGFKNYKELLTHFFNLKILKK